MNQPLPNGIMGQALALAMHREALCRQAPPCTCGSNQVQLLGYIPAPAVWRCRICHRVWDEHHAEEETKKTFTNK
jgi:hypothetical protein